MNLAPDARAERAVHHLMALQASFAGKRLANHGRFVMALAVGLHLRLCAGQVLFDQLSDVARVHVQAPSTGSRSLAHGPQPLRRARLPIAYNRARGGAAARASRTLVRNTVVMIVLALLAGATWIWTWPPQNQTARSERSADGGPLGYYVRGARWSVTDEQGRVTYRIRAERLDEVPSEERLRLEGVAVEYQPSDATAWAISAASANALKDGSLLELSGDVEMRSVPTDGSAQQTILTEALRFWPDTSNIESEHLVEIRLGDWRLRAMGLSSDLKGQTLTLESEVHGTFAPR